tara:strand:+ start:591 stop:932 length:342 start_codon:yes stop_codon:yes gene_type:complete
MKPSKTKAPYSKSEDNYISKCATTSLSVTGGLAKAAKALGRSPQAVTQRYYGTIRRKASLTVKNRPETVGSVISKETQETLDKSVRFTLASLAKDHNHITIEVKGTQVTAVFK